MRSYPNHNSGLSLFIVVFSLICGASVLGISTALLREISQDSPKPEDPNSSSYSSTKDSRNSTLVIVVSIGIFAVSIQLITSIALWFTNEKDSKSLLVGFACAQGTIQTILLICLGFVIHEYFKPIELAASNSSKSKTGHGFWIILSFNVIFHIIAISYLMILVIKRNDQNDDMEEMTAVVIHRKVPSRIPNSNFKRHGGFH